MIGCFDELTYSRYVDGDLAGDETRRVETHLEGCARCRMLIEALRQENTLLAEALQAPVEESAREHWLPLLWAGLVVVASGIMAQAATALLSSRPPAGLEWLHPVHGAPEWYGLFATAFYLVENGREAMTSLITVVGVAMALALATSMLWLALRRRRHASAAALALLIVAVCTGRASAVERRTGQNVVLGAGETIQDTLLVMGESIAIEGTVEGDLVAMGRQVTLRGAVRGNLMCFCRTLDLEGTVGGNIYSFAQWANLRGETEKNMYSFTQNLTLSPDSRVGENLIAFTQDAEVHGRVGRDAMAFCESVNVRGTIGRHFRAHAERVTLVAPARVGGDLIARVRNLKNVQIGEGVIIQGKTDAQARPRPPRWARARFWVWQAIQLLGALLVGVLLAWLLPGTLSAGLETGDRIARQCGKGFLLLVAVPIAAVIAAMTLVGIPVALIAVALWVIAIYLAKVFVGAALGRALIRPRRGGLADVALFLLVGLLIVFVLTNLPYVGQVFMLGVVLWGLGILFERVKGVWPRRLAAA